MARKGEECPRSVKRNKWPEGRYPLVPVNILRRNDLTTTCLGKKTENARAFRPFSSSKSAKAHPDRLKRNPAPFPPFLALFNRSRWQLIADHNERPNRTTIIRRFLFQLVGTISLI